MRSWNFWSLTLGVVVAGLLVAATGSQEGSTQATNTTAATQPASEAQTVESPAEPAVAAAVQGDESDLTNALVRPISTGKSLPPNLKLTQSALEVVRLAESGVEESVLMAFVTNSMTPFNLGADEIIYLNDIGVPGLVVAAMLQRDKALTELAAGGAVPPAETVSGPTTNWITQEPVAGGPYAPQPAGPPVGTEAAPAPALQPDYAAVEYAPPPAVAVEYSTFYDSLAPYGTWVDVGGYGPCWRPTAAIAYPGWRPYCHGGRWIYSDCGWYWLSGYSWGWAPFHYGRWFQHSHWGWCWAPGSVWGPAWVGWRYGGGYCGWAPLPPAAGFGFGLGLTYHGRPARPDCGFGLGAHSYTFVETSHFRDHRLHLQASPHQEAARVFNQTTPSSRITASNNRVVNHGIPSSRVADATRAEVRPVAIRPVTGPVARGARGERFERDGRTLAVYRPSFASTSGGSPASGGSARSEVRSGGSAATPAPTTQGAAAGSLSRASFGSTGARPSAGQPAVSGAPSPAALSPAPTTIRPSPEPTTVSPTRTARLTPVTPVTRSESARPSGGSSSTSLSIINQDSPRPSTTFPVRTEPSSRQPITQPAVPTTETPRTRPVSPTRESIVRPSVSARPQPLTTPAVSAPARTEQTRSTLRPSEPPTRIERPRQAVIPSSPAPAPTPRPIPTPSFSVPRYTPAPAPVSTPSIRTLTPAPTPSAPRPEIRMSTPAPARSVPAPTPAPSIRMSTPEPVRSAPAPAIVPTPRASAPSFSPAPTRSFSIPAASPAPRSQTIESRPSASPVSSAPSTSTSGGQGRSSSGPRGR